MSETPTPASPPFSEITGRWWVLLLRAVAALAVGALAFVWPGVTLLALILIFAAYALADGVLSLYAAVTGGGEGSRGWLLFEGVVGVGAGLAALAWPGLTLLWLTVLMGGWGVARGVVEIATAIRLRRQIEGEWSLILHGVVMVLFGLVVLFSPGVGALALAWLVGGLALASGVLMAVLAFRLRRLQGG